MTRVLPVADGVLKHQIHYQAGVGGDGRRINDAVATVWTYKAGGSPVSGTRVTAEQDAIQAWFTSQLRGTLPTTWQIVDLRTWDYGLDPAPKTRRIFLPVQGTLNVSGLAVGPLPNQGATWIIALRTQAVGSLTRNRLNGRIGWPILYQTTAGGGTTYFPSSSQVLTAWNALRTTLNGTGSVGTWSVVSFHSGGVPRVTPLVVTVDHLLVSRVGHQRRRDARFGPYTRGS